VTIRIWGNGNPQVRVHTLQVKAQRNICISYDMDRRHLPSKRRAFSDEPSEGSFIIPKKNGKLVHYLLVVCVEPTSLVRRQQGDVNKFFLDGGLFCRCKHRSGWKETRGTDHRHMFETQIALVSKVIGRLHLPNKNDIFDTNPETSVCIIPGFC
jgi:hypothetical protein